MILFDTTAPDVTGANAWRKRCVWLDLTVPGSPTVNVYKEGTSPGWVNVNNIITNGAIKTSMIADYNPATPNTGVTIAKLSPAGGTANQLIRVNATATAFEFVSLSSLVTSGSISVGSLITTGIPAGQFRMAAVYGPGIATWYTAQNVIDALANAAIPTDLLSPAGAATSRSQFLTTRTGDPFATWRYFNPAVDLLANSLGGDRIVNTSIPLTKIIPATADAVLVTTGGDVDWVPANTLSGVIASKQVVEVTPLPAANVPVDVITYAATGGRADIYQFYLKCITTDHGFDPGDEVPLASLGNDDGGANEAGPLIQFDASTAKVIHRGPAFYQVQSATASTIVAISTVGERARWALKCVAIRFN
jgi:hypothetical protein